MLRVPSYIPDWWFVRTHSISTLAAMLMLSVSGCADLLDIAENPVLVPHDPWMCEGDDTMQPATPAAEKATVRVHVCDFISTNCGMTVSGLTAKLCDKRDFSCSAPMMKDIRDVEGDLAVEVPTGGSLGEGFDGYLQVDGPLVDCSLAGPGACMLAPGCDPTAMMPNDKCKIPAYITGLLFFNPPVTNDTPRPMVLPLIPTVASLALVSAAGARSVDPTLGTVFATALDCEGQPASGLTFGVSTGAPMYGKLFQEKGVISSMAAATDSSGIGGLLGVPMGFTKVSAFPVGTTREVASIGAQIVPRTVTYVTLIPPHE
jgi:hypothetical protein